MKLFKQVKPTRNLARLFLVAGGGILAFSVVYGTIISGILPDISSFIINNILKLSRLLGATPENDARVYWYVSRAAGVTAYLILSVTVTFGLTITGKTVKKTERLPVIYETHQVMAISSFILGMIHAFILLGDRFINFQLPTLLVPFKSPYRPLWVGIGVVGFYMMILTIVSFYMRGVITFRGWRIWHYTTFLTYISVTVHGIMSGTDTPTWPMLTVYALSVATVVIMLTIRIYSVIRSRSRKKTRYTNIEEEFRPI